MNKKVKKLWLRALRRRKNPYRQGRGSLADEAGFCCLGVLCDVHREQTGKGEWSGASYASTERHDCAALTLPLFVMEWAELSDDDPYVKCEGTPVSLSTLNDGGIDREPRTFRQIANAIEGYL